MTIEIDKENRMVAINAMEYKMLLRDAEKMRRLEMGGVENWPLYDVALNPYDDESYADTCMILDDRVNQMKAINE